MIVRRGKPRILKKHLSIQLCLADERAGEGDLSLGSRISLPNVNKLLGFYLLPTLSFRGKDNSGENMSQINSIS
jgi:hypothetical protein